MSKNVDDNVDDVIFVNSATTGVKSTIRKLNLFWPLV